MQYPGPTLIVNQGETITVTLKNELPAPAGTSPSCSRASERHGHGRRGGPLTQEARRRRLTTVTYTFTATQPGPTLYHSGTRTDLQVEMGLVGAIIVRPTGFDHDEPQGLRPCRPRVRPRVPVPADRDGPEDPPGRRPARIYTVDTTDVLPDLLVHQRPLRAGHHVADGVPWLPNQPYNSMPMMQPGREGAAAGHRRRARPAPLPSPREQRTDHRAGRPVLESAPGAGPDLAVSDFTIPRLPGRRWTPSSSGPARTRLGHLRRPGHDCVDGNGDNFDDTTYEYCPGPRQALPGDSARATGAHLRRVLERQPVPGRLDALPPGQGGLNPNGGFTSCGTPTTRRK